jgi:hypothetical protein
MIYVIGVHHQEEQFPHYMNKSAEIAKLKAVIRELHKKQNLALIAEEWSEDIRRYQSVTTTHSEDVARELGIPHLSCDPDLAERNRLGFKSREEIANELGFDFHFIMPGTDEERRVNERAEEFDKIREPYWLDQIVGSGYGYKDILLVCGYEHTESFIALAKSKGYEATKVPFNR